MNPLGHFLESLWCGRCIGVSGSEEDEEGVPGLFANRQQILLPQLGPPELYDLAAQQVHHFVVGLASLSLRDLADLREVNQNDGQVATPKQTLAQHGEELVVSGEIDGAQRSSHIDGACTSLRRLDCRR